MYDFTILVLHNAYATSVAVTVDMLRASAMLAPQLNLPRPTWRVVSPNGGATSLSGGLQIATGRMPSRAGRDTSVWIAPGMGIDNANDIFRMLVGEGAQQAAAALQKHVAAGGEVAASCSAVFLLQAAGLLAGRRATTSWWLAAELGRIEPECIVDSDRMVVIDGPVTTAGAALGQTDLMLALFRKRFGSSLSEIVGKMLLLDGRQAQSPFVIPAMQAIGHTLITRLNQRIESALPNIPSVPRLALEFAMSQRTLTRQVRAATGQGALALIQSVRLNRARMLIESSRMTIEQVAEQVGYEDATALRRLMRKAAGVNPSRFRKFGQG
jgi:transcriptional regulator GlxA family with amidase domain